MNLAGLLFHLARLLRPVWNASVFIRPPPKAVGGAGVFAGESLRPEGVVSIGARRPRSKADLEKTEVNEAVLLPRLTREECTELSARLSNLADFILGTTELVQHMTSDNEVFADIVSKAGMAAELQYPEDEIERTPDLPQDPAARQVWLQARAAFMETLFVCLLFRLIKRASQAAAVMALVADPAYGACHILAKCAEGDGAGAPGVVHTITDDRLLELARGMTWSALITEEADGKNLVEGIFSRVLHLLRARAADARGPGSAAPSAVPFASVPRNGASISKVVDRDPATRLAAKLVAECSMFFSRASQLLVTAHAAADNAASSNVPADRAALLADSLRIALEAVSEWRPDDLRHNMDDIVRLDDKFRDAGFYGGAVQLMLATASQAAGGPDRLGTLPPDVDETARVSSATEVRRAAYRSVIDTLEVLRGGAQVQVGGASLAGSFLGGGGGNLRLSMLGSALGGGSLNPAFVSLLDQVLRSIDLYFHEYLYRWMLGAGLGNLMRGISTDFIEPFLRTRVDVANAPLLFAHQIANKKYAGECIARTAVRRLRMADGVARPRAAHAKSRAPPLALLPAHTAVSHSHCPLTPLLSTSHPLAEAARMLHASALEVKAELRDNIVLSERIKQLELAVKTARESTTQLGGKVTEGEVRDWEHTLKLLKVQSDVLARMQGVLDGPGISTKPALEKQVQDHVAQLTYETYVPARLWEMVESCQLIDCKVAVLGE
jgi:hypothetical protein